MVRNMAFVIPFLLMSLPAAAGDWPQSDVDKALSIVREHESAEDCLKDMGSKVSYHVRQRDLNGDGVNELEVTAMPADLGNGQSACFARSGSTVHLLISDGAGGWNYQFGFDMAEPTYHRSNTDWPDVEFTGAGFCFPIWRHYEGAYGMWKVCDNGRLIYADAASWIKKGEAVPRNAGAAPTQSSKVGGQTGAYLHEKDMSGAEFDHNGSLMAVDPKRGMIIYKKPKSSIRDVVKPGDVLFVADEAWDMYEVDKPIGGTAWVFKKGCAPVGYRVEGGMRTSWHTIVLKGEAPVREKSSCEVAGLSKTSANAELKFDNVED